MTTKIYEIANQLEGVIRDLPEYQAAKSAKEEIDKAPQAKEIWVEFVALQQELKEQLQAGQIPSEKEQNKLSEMQEKIEKNAVLKHYFDQQQRLALYLSDVERIMYKPLHELMKE